MYLYGRALLGFLDHILSNCHNNSLGSVHWTGTDFNPIEGMMVGKKKLLMKKWQ